MNLKEIIGQGNFATRLNSKLLELMDKNPDFVYGQNKSCYYNRGPGGNPKKCNGCIFGQALQNMGWDNKEELSFKGYLSELLYEFVGEDILRIDDYHIDCWFNIQNDQDNGCTWGSLKQYLN